MIKRASLLSFLLGVALFSLFSQSVPQGISYQAVLRDNGTPLANQNLDVRFSIRSDAPGGPIVYQETQSLLINEYSLLLATIGQGTPVSGNFADIDWAADEHYLEVEVDNNAGWVGISNSRLESVPYSQVASRALMNLNDLLDVETAPLSGQILRWDGSQWVAGEDQDENTTYLAGAGIEITPTGVIHNEGDLDPTDDLLIGSGAAGDLTGTYPAPTIKSIQGRVLSGQQPSPGDVWKWNGNEWAPAPDDFNESHWTKLQQNIHYQGGNVGIGTNQPTYPLHLLEVDSMPTDVRGLFIDVDKLTNSGGNTTGLYVDAFKSGATGTTYGANLRARNHNSGSSPVYGSFNYAYKLANSGAAYGIYGTTAGQAPIEYAGYFDGDVFSTGSYLPSDATLKHQIQPVASSLDQILQLRVASYEYRQEAYPHMHLPEGLQVGFVAQEVAQVFPELVKAQLHPAADPAAVAAGEMADGPAISFQGLNYVGLVPHLTRAVQEQQAQIEAQEARIQALEAMVQELLDRE